MASLTHPTPNFASLLRLQAALRPDFPVFTWLRDGEEEEASLSFGALQSQAARVAANLRAVCAPGDRALLLFEPGLDFIPAFFGCLLAGVVAVPAPLPHPARPERTLPRLRAIARDAAPTLAITHGGRVELLQSEAPFSSLRWLDVQQLAPAPEASCAVDPDALAHLQYTSGSTGSPKGVMLSQTKLLSGCASIQRCGAFDAESVQAMWAPHLHDYGLVEGILHPVYTGCRCVLMSPSEFVQSPMRWLRAITRFRVTHSGGPDFAYALCAKRAEKLDELDLRSWRWALNAAEPIRPETLRRFAEVFAPCGFSIDNFQPAFGLAEATLQVSNRRGPVFLTLSAAALERGQVQPPDGGRTRELVGSGKAALHTEICIVDPERLETCDPSTVGEIWVRSPTVADGVLGQPDAEGFNAHLSGGEGPFLRTGDLGFLRDGELFVTGRRKDLLILHGQNHHPQDVEWALDDLARAVPGLRAGSNAAFPMEVDGEEHLALLQEIEPSTDPSGLIERICAAVYERLELSPRVVLLLPPGALPRTSSGKRMRSACREALLAGALRPLAAWRMGALAASAEASEVKLLALAATVLGVAPERLDPRLPLAALGLDSVRGVQLAQALGLSPATLWEYPTLRALARHLAGHDDAAPQRADAQHGEPIAIVGLACRLPGAPNPEALGRLLREGLDAVVAVPPERWPAALFDADPDAPGKIISDQAGLLPDIYDFDAEFFGISPREAARMDPQHRLLLELCHEALEQGGFSPEAQQQSRTGVFVGISTAEYTRLLPRDDIDAYTGTGNLPSLAAGRVAWQLGLRGPTLAVDTACSSSLVAIHLAIQSLRSGECAMALAGGVNLMLDPDASVAASKLRALSPTGRCHSFDASADGYVRGEGGGVVLLKRLSDSKDDRIFAVIRGSAINHDGRSNGLTAPSGPAQQAVVQEALVNAKVAPSEVVYVEAHGTGTPLGDPVELRALARVLGEGRAADRPLHVGALKSQIGHTEAAAGVAGLLKVVIALNSEQIPANLHFCTPNPHIAALPIRVLQAPTAWPPGRRVAGVSAFGLSGTNAHLVLEAAENPPETVTSAGPTLLTLSARSEGALRQLAREYAERLSTASLADLAYTAATGRSGHALRVAVVASHAEEAIAWLNRVASGAVAPSRAGATAESVHPESPEAAARLWCQGAAVNPGAFVWGRKIDLPTYPFERKPLRIQPPAPREAPLSGEPIQVPGPTLHQRVPLGGAIGWLDDHRIHGEIVVPAAFFVSVILAVAEARLGLAQATLGELSFQRALSLPGPDSLILSLEPKDLGWYIRISTQQGAEWRVHVEGWLRAGAQPTGDTSLGTQQQQVSEPLDLSPFYARLAQSRVEWRPGWRRVVGAWRSVGRALVHIQPLGVHVAPLHPIVLDNALGTALADPLLRGPGWGDAPYLPWSMDAVRWLGSPRGGVWAASTLREASEDTLRCDIALYDEDGTLIAEIDGMRFRRATRQALQREAPAPTAAPAAASTDLGEVVRQCVARVLGRDDPAAIPGARPLVDLGLDSLMAVELREGLNEHLGLNLAATVAFDHPTVDALIGFLSAKRAPPIQRRRPAADAPIAIVGAACRLPGGANTPEDFWQLLREGRDAIVDIPAARFDAALHFSAELGKRGTLYSKRAGLLTTPIDTFDASFFGVRSREAKSMDPQQRLLLELSWEALLRSGLPPESLAGTRTGVFLGMSSTDYVHQRMIQHGTAWIDAFAATGNAPSIAAGRLSYHLGLQGPCITLDTACSSALVAVHLAVQSLRSGECDLALVAGVNLILSPLVSLYFSQLNALSAEGRCRTFDAAADGYVRGEGGGVLVLQRYADAKAAKAPISALIRGTATNQDGRTNGLTAPSGPAQERVIREALEQAGLAPDDIDYVEAHGTGTPLGDPIEANALGRVFAGRDRPLWIGSVKTNLGHLEAAAGVAGLLKVALSLSRGEIPAHLHFSDPSPHISWDTLPLRVPTRHTRWPGEGTRRAGVSAFGFSGTNAHVVLEAAPEAPSRPSLPLTPLQRQRFWYDEP